MKGAVCAWTMFRMLGDSKRLCSTALAKADAAMTTAIDTPAAARVSRGRRARDLEWRIGSSTLRYERAESASEAPHAASRAPNDACGKLNASAISTGQCQRYHAYDTRPRYRSGGDPRIVLARWGRRSRPPKIMSAVATVGSKSATPWLEARSGMTNAVRRSPEMPASASQASPGCVVSPSGLAARYAAATAPIPNSQARNG